MARRRQLSGAQALESPRGVPALDGDASAMDDDVHARMALAPPLSFTTPLAALKSSEIDRPPLALEGDDYAGDPSTTGVVLTGGGTTSGVFETASDSDWFSVSLQAGQTLVINTNGNNTRPQISFYDSAGNLLTPEFVIQEGAFSWVYGLRAPSTGTFFVAASPNAFPGVIGYNFSAQVYPADDFAANTSTAGSLDSGSASGTFEHVYDTDWFAITLDAGQSIDVTGPFWLTHIRFYDSAGNPVEVDFLREFNAGNTLQTAGFTATTAGTYYVSVAGIGTGSTYTLTTQDRTAPHPNDVDTFIPITTSGVVEGVVGPSGRQWFSVHLEAGQSIYLDELNTSIYSAYGQSMSVHHGVDETQQWYTLFTAGVAGTYYFATGGPAGSTYRHETLIYTDDSADGLPPFNGNEAITLLNPAGQVFNGRTEVFDDDDYFAFDLVAGQTVRIQLEYADLHYLTEGLRVFSLDEHGGGLTYYGQLESVDLSEIVFTAPADGRYYVEINGMYRYVGDYTLTLSPATPADALDGDPSILPSMPAQPATANVTSTIVHSSGTNTVAAGTTLYGFNLVDNAYFAPYGSPIIHASSHAAGTPNPTLNNAGVIYSYADIYRPFGVTAVTADRLINSGTIVAQSETPYPDVLNPTSAVAVYIVGYLPQGEEGLQNTGDIVARAVGGGAVAVATSGTSAIFRNSGLIAAEGQWGDRDSALAGGATAVSFGNGGTLINEAGGRIVAVGDGFASAVDVSAGGLTVTNHGIIEAQARGAHALSVGIRAWPNSGNAGLVSATVHNYGTIRADQALYGEVTLFNYAGGVVEGDIVLFSSANIMDHDDVQTITNQGTINGDIDMGDGADVIDNAGGVINGAVKMGMGDDTFTGGANADAVAGGHGEDALNGNGGDDLLLGGHSDDTLTGGAGADGLYGEIGADRIVTAGGDAASGGAGHDRIETGDYAFASIAGDTGFDTWVLPAGARTLDLSLVAASGRVSGIEALALAGNQTVVVRQADVAALSGASSLYVSGAATNAVYLSGAWTSAGQSVRDGITYNAYVVASVLVFVEVGVGVTVGASPPAGTGLDAIGPGAAPAPGSVEGVHLTPAIVTEGYRIINDLVIGPDEVWQSQYGSAVLSAGYLTGPSLTNYGAISSTGSTHPHVSSPAGLGEFGAATALQLLHIDTVMNHGSVTATAIMNGAAVGYWGGASFGFVNAATGTIHAIADGGFAIAVDGYDLSAGGPGLGQWAFANFGDIYAFSNTGFAVGLSEGNSARILNEGVIEANGGDGAVAVQFNGGGSEILNRGDIIAFAPPTSTFFSYAISAFGFTTIDNEGLIAAEIAIDFLDRYNEGSIINNSGTIIGALVRYNDVPGSILLGTVWLTNSGTMIGPILFDSGVSRHIFVNTGYMEGDILLAGGNDSYDGRSGQHVGEFHAGAGTDLLQGGANADQFFGEDGADTLEGYGGDDALDGGSGADAMTGGQGADTYGVDNAGDVVTEAAGEGTDTVRSSLASYTLGANVENLTLLAGAGSGTGNALNNVITGNSAGNILSGGAGNDTLAGGLGNDLVRGEAGADTINYAFGDGADNIDGGADSDTLNITGDAAENTVRVAYDGSALTHAYDGALSNLEAVNANMGAGTDWLVYTAAGAVSVNLGAGAASGFASVLNVENVIGGAGGDTITGSGAANRLEGALGDDTLNGAGGADILMGGDGADALAGGLAGDNVQGGAGNDTLAWSWGDGADTLNGGADADTLNAAGSSADNIVRAAWNGSAITNLFDNVIVSIEAINLSMGDGVDWLVFTSALGVTVDLGANTGTGFASVLGVENVIGGAGGDTLTGSALDNRLDGAGGADTLNGGAGADILLGGDGADTLAGGLGNDSSQGGAGNDTFTYAWGDGRDSFNGGADFDTVNASGSAVENILRAAWNGSALTGLFDNALVSIEAVNLDGGGGQDWLSYTSSAGVTVNLGAGTASGFASITSVENAVGGTGADALTGDANANKLLGGDGADTLTGAGGADTLTGGLGSDTFVYAAGAGGDVIVDFDAAAAGGQDFIDVTAFGITAGTFASRVVITDLGANTLVTIDGSVTINLQNVTGDGDNSITSADFILS